MTSQISGLRDGKEWPAPGETIDLPDDEANLVVSGGHAEMSDEPEPEPEPVKAEKPEPETAQAKSDAETR